MDGYVSIAVTALLCVLALVAGIGIGAWAVQSVMGLELDSSSSPANKEE